MILVDTSVWIDHFRIGLAALSGLLDRGLVLTHPFVIGEIALGNLRQRKLVMQLLADQPQAAVASDSELRHFIEHHALFGRGVGYVDVHLLAAARMTAGVTLWTFDKRLREVAGELGLAAV